MYNSLLVFGIVLFDFIKVCIGHFLFLNLTWYETYFYNGWVYSFTDLCHYSSPHSYFTYHGCYFWLRQPNFKKYVSIRKRTLYILHNTLFLFGCVLKIFFRHNLENDALKNFLHKVEKILKGSLDSILSPSPSVKIQITGRKVCLRWKGKNCWVLSTNFSNQKVCWHHPAMFCLITSSKLSAHNLNFHWRWRWWDGIQAIFLNLI